MASSCASEKPVSCRTTPPNGNDLSRRRVAPKPGNDGLRNSLVEPGGLEVLERRAASRPLGWGDGGAGVLLAVSAGGDGGGDGGVDGSCAACGGCEGGCEAGRGTEDAVASFVVWPSLSDAKHRRGVSQDGTVVECRCRTRFSEPHEEERETAWEAAHEVRVASPAREMTEDDAPRHSARMNAYGGQHRMSGERQAEASEQQQSGRVRVGQLVVMTTGGPV